MEGRTIKKIYACRLVLCSCYCILDLFYFTSILHLSSENLRGSYPTALEVKLLNPLGSFNEAKLQCTLL